MDPLDIELRLVELQNGLAQTFADELRSFAPKVSAELCAALEKHLRSWDGAPQQLRQDTKPRLSAGLIGCPQPPVPPAAVAETTDVKPVGHQDSLRISEVEDFLALVPASSISNEAINVDTITEFSPEAYPELLSPAGNEARNNSEGLQIVRSLTGGSRVHFAPSIQTLDSGGTPEIGRDLAVERLRSGRGMEHTWTYRYPKSYLAANGWDSEIQPVRSGSKRPSDKPKLQANEKEEDDDAVPLPTIRAAGAAGASGRTTGSSLPADLLKAFAGRYASQNKVAQYFDDQDGTQNIGRCRALVQRIVLSFGFDCFWCLMILLYSLLLGAQTEVSMRVAQGHLEDARTVHVIGLLFGAAFFIEMVLRVIVLRERFFTLPGWKWNILDLVVVVAFFVEQLLVFALSEQRWSGPHVAVLRVTFFFRLFRIVRVARLMHMLQDLRLIGRSVLSSLRSLVWFVLLLFLFIYAASVYIMQSVADVSTSCAGCAAEGTDLHKYFGSLDRSVLTLFMSITGGIDWSNACQPLIDHLSPNMGFIYTVYIAFTTISMMNVITGIVVDSALKNSSVEGDLEMVKILREVFSEQLMDEGSVTWFEFQQQLGNPKLVSYFRSIDLDPSEARGLFELLDISGGDSIDVEDFISGCVRLRGPARAIDLGTLMAEMRRLRVQLEMHSANVEDSLKGKEDSITTSRLNTSGHSSSRGVGSKGLSEFSGCMHGNSSKISAPASMLAEQPLFPRGSTTNDIQRVNAQREGGGSMSMSMSAASLLNALK